MSEELLQRDLLNNPEKLGKWNFYNIGATTLNTLKRHKIISNIDYKKYGSRKPDGLITQGKKVIAVVANKLPQKLKSSKQIDKEITDWIDVTKKLKSKLLIVTDTKKTIWVNTLTKEIIKDEDGNELQKVFIPKELETIKLIEKILDSIDDKNSKLISPKLKDPSNLAKKIWQDIWSVSGATPENCLYTFVELFIFKYLSDLNVLTGFYNFYDLLMKYETNSDEQVLEFYAETIRKEIKNKFKENPKDKTTIINGTIFVSKDDKAVKGYSTVFKKVLEKFNNEGKLENIHHDFKSKIFESFLKESISKKNWGQFFTPLKVVRAIVSMIDLKEGMKICDPACGVGKFLLEPILKEINRFYKIDKNNKLKSEITLVGYDKGFDKDEQKTIILAKANMLIYFSDLLKENPEATEQFSNLFNDTFLLKTNSILGTLADPIDSEYDLILTNPPYVTSGSSNLKEEIKKSGLEYHYKINALGVEGLFLEWIIKALKPNGKAIIVIPDGVLSRTNDKNIRKYIMDECSIDAIISLPSKTFFTTQKKTYILAITKKNNKSIKQTEPVFSYLVSNIGETLDIYRIEIPENDLEDSVVYYNQFKGAKKHFKADNKKCKIIDFKFFENNYQDSWIIEKLWNEEDLIELGIKEEENKINVNEFATFLSNINLTITEYQEQLNSITSEIKNYKDVFLSDEKYFKIYTGGLGYKKNEYVKYDTKSEEDIPVYTATLNPVAHFKTGNISRLPTGCDEEHPHISFGSDGDGTAGTNIILHKKPYYLNTSRLSFGIIDDNIFPEYIFYAIQDIKRKYGFDYKYKATLKNVGIIKISIPIDSNGNFDIEAQKEIATKNKMIAEIKKELKLKLGEVIEAKIEFN